MASDSLRARQRAVNPEREDGQLARRSACGGSTVPAVAAAMTRAR